MRVRFVPAFFGSRPTPLIPDHFEQLKYRLMETRGIKGEEFNQLNLNGVSTANFLTPNDITAKQYKRRSINGRCIFAQPIPNINLELDEATSFSLFKSKMNNKKQRLTPEKEEELRRTHSVERCTAECIIQFLMGIFSYIESEFLQEEGLFHVSRDLEETKTLADVIDAQCMKAGGSRFILLLN